MAGAGRAGQAWSHGELGFLEDKYFHFNVENTFHGTKRGKHITRKIRDKNIQLNKGETILGIMKENTFHGTMGENTFHGIMKENTFHGLMKENTFHGIMKENTFHEQKGKTHFTKAMGENTSRTFGNIQFTEHWE